MILVGLILRLVFLSPAEANALVCGEDLACRAFLDLTTLREGKRTGVKGHRARTGLHRTDADLSARAWRNHRDKLTDFCPDHDEPEAGWSTRGHLGLMAATHWNLLPWWLRCAPPSVFDIPIVSAHVAKRKRDKWCAQGRCTRRELNSIWANGRPPEDEERE